MNSSVPYHVSVDQALDAFQAWRTVPVVHRGELIRIFGIGLRENKEELARSITYSMDKTIRESRGEIQEIIDMCDFAAGLSRQLYGLTMGSERPGHRLQETWHPLGVVGVITAFNFPAAVWGWNFCLSTICGNSTVWKPSERCSGPLAYELHDIFFQACTRFGEPSLGKIHQVLDSDVETGIKLANDPRIALLSATGSVAMGRSVAQAVGKRLGRTLLELGGNNAAVVSLQCDIDLAVQGCVFGATATTGQRCTSLRRIFVHSGVYDLFVDKLKAAFKTIVIGDPLDETKLMGPLVDASAYTHMSLAISTAIIEGGQIEYGGSRVFPYRHDPRPYVEPCIITALRPLPVMQTETFAPVVYVVPYDTLDEAIQYVNDVPQGLSSCIFTDNMRESERFLRDSYNGLVNVNTSTSGAEIGGAFGGEKDTGGGRESGSDAWKHYMRRVTSTINSSGKLPLAQGIKFE